MGTEGSLRHLAFFEELGEMDETNPTWYSVSAGLVVMRLIDAWIAEGSASVSTDRWTVEEVRAAVAAIPETLPHRRILTAIVDCIDGARVVDVHLVSPRLMAYGHVLEYESRWSLAADVYRTLVAYAHPIDDADLVVSAHIQLAFCLRMVGDLDASAASYADASRVASVAGDMIGVLRARLGDAKVSIARGNMPRAESILEETIAAAGEHSLRDVHSHALHERAHVAGLRGEYERSIQFAYKALDLAPSQRQKDRILGDIAASFMYLGLDDVARDAYLVLAATAQEQYVRWMSELNLLEIAAKQGSELQFDRYRRDLEHHDFTPQLRVIYLIHVGRGYHTLGDSTTGIAYLERAVEIAEQFRLNQLLFEAEQALGEARRRAAVARRTSTLDTEPVREVIGVIRELKELAGVG